ncbi:hypothetical protein D7X25_27475 [bacterium 1XD42-8]|jgi:hypothetical protein|nr:hypothetical protein [Lachnospiraceae bacterium]RKJ42373.1 hypothetical protein D7X25_27475 [bacterium 1XD42-8]
MRKKMKRAVIMILGIVLMGCGKSQQSSQATQEDIPQSMEQEIQQDIAVDKVETKAVEKNEQITREYEDNFAVDSKAAKEFAEKVKDVVAKKDLEALAELTAFPVYVGLPDVNVVEKKEDFLNLGAETVFTEELLTSVEMADIENFQPSMAGFSISGGGTANINFGVVNGVLQINGINY